MQDLTGRRVWDGDVLDDIANGEFRIPTHRAQGISRVPRRLRSVPGCWGQLPCRVCRRIELQMRSITPIENYNLHVGRPLNQLRTTTNSSWADYFGTDGKSRSSPAAGFERTDNASQGEGAIVNETSGDGKDLKGHNRLARVCGLRVVVGADHAAGIR